MTTKQLTIKLPYPVTEDSFFLCIDTTGLHAEVSAITTIGIAYPKGQQLFYNQWFLETGETQKALLASFFQAVADKKRVITYYGNRFALPFLAQKADEYALTNPLSAMISDDYYAIVHPLKKILPLSSLKQTAVEKACQIQRTLSLSGKKLIKCYQTYHKTQDPAMKDMLLLHNKESLETLCHFASLFAYRDLIHGNFSSCTMEKNTPDEEEIHFHLVLPFAVPMPIHHSLSDLRLDVSERTGTLSMKPDAQGMLKHYYQNPKDYYYLPYEDRAIHKSLASFVPKEFRTKATKTTCYEKIACDHPALASKSSLNAFLCDTIAFLC